MTTGIARAKRAYLRVEKRDKYGRKYIGQNESVISNGMFSAAEAERELWKAADGSDERVVDAVVETYGKNTPELETNPRRGTSQGVVFGGFRAASWLPESPLMRRLQERSRE